jgi:hypothetical protein
MFFRQGMLHIVQPVPLCKQSAEHYTCRKGIALKARFKGLALARFAERAVHLMPNARRAVRRKEMTSWPR